MSFIKNLAKKSLLKASWSFYVWSSCPLSHQVPASWIIQMKISAIQKRTWHSICVSFLGPTRFKLCVRIDNFPPLELQAQEQESNPEPGFPQAVGPEDHKTNHLHFSGIKPLQADVEEDNPPRKVDQAKDSTALSEVPITTPNGDDPATIGLMGLKSSPATNQEPTQGRGTSLQLGPMTSMLKQDNQVAKLGAATNERTPRPSAILLPLDPSPQFPGPALHKCPDDSQKNVKFGGGVLYRPKDPALQTYCHFEIKVMLLWLIQLLPCFVFAVYQFSSRSSGPPAPLPAVFRPVGVPFGPVQFTKYPLKPKYKDYTPEKIIELDPLARIQSTIRYNCQGWWIFSTPKLFRGKFNYLLAYNIYMEPPVTPKLMPASSPNLPTDHTSKLFGIVYITLTGVVDTIILAASPWSWVGKSASYLLKLIPLLWWALPARNPAQVTPRNGGPAA
ncbi:hypothetical protein DSO57_1025126 [Entomophthora muscae]|uniref:Uncharacterized protein n=1 Tax=Entomophthora muscae TaxID=34485 RepID=A0ACC2RH74_9FUNG|nr:hypothetical protein DSO57_1025126 [Entomophthora muscae]